MIGGEGSPGELVLPHPNLGPEAPPSDALSAWWSVPAIIAIILAATVILSMRRRRRAAALSRRGGVSADPEATQTAEMVALAASLREALAARFGEPWRALTTEEIAESAALAEALGPEEAGRLLTLFREADLAKFAGLDQAQSVPDDRWGAVADALRSSIAAGARSTTTGK